MKTSYQVSLEEGKIYAPTFKDVCLICGQDINGEDYTITLKLDPSWDRVEPFNFDKHCTDELKGYKHFKCLK